MKTCSILRVSQWSKLTLCGRSHLGVVALWQLELGEGISSCPLGGQQGHVVVDAKHGLLAVLHEGLIEGEYIEVDAAGIQHLLHVQVG